MKIDNNKDYFKLSREEKLYVDTRFCLIRDMLDMFQDKYVCEVLTDVDTTTYAEWLILVVTPKGNTNHISLTNRQDYDRIIHASYTDFTKIIGTLLSKLKKA